MRPRESLALKRLALAAAFIALVAVVAVSLWRMAQEARLARPTPPQTSQDALGEPGSPYQVPVPAPIRDPGELVADGEGRFIPTPSALRFFDTQLALARGRSPEETRAHVGDEIDRKLAAGAAAEAHALFDRYLAYLDRARELITAEETDGSTPERLATLRALRVEIFGPALHEALFAQEEGLAQASIERRRILDDHNLSDREKIERLAELQTQLPEAVRRAEERTYAPMRRPEEEAAAEQPPDPGAGAAPPTQAPWEERMAAYRTERDRVLENVRHTDDADRGFYLRQVRERHFLPEELPRVETLDRLDMIERAQDAAVPPQQ